jgi:uncharacterized protein
MKPTPNIKEVNSELFVIPRKDSSYILYSPLNRKVGIINASGVNTLSKYLEESYLNEEETSFIEGLQHQRFLNDKPLRKPVFPEDYSFMPNEVTLFPTSLCNLRCRYCYADAGKKNATMPFEIAKAAVDLIARNAGLAGLPKFAVGFHGGGEPTLAWDLITKTVDYAYVVAEKKGLELEVFAASNGMFNNEQRDYIVNRFTNLTISMDGPPDIQDYNRPMVNGNGSSDIITDNLKFLDDHNFSYGIRATITGRTVTRIEEIVTWFKSAFNIRFLHIEPVWFCGRCHTTGEHPPVDADFIHYFVKGLEKANELKISLVYSGLRVDSLLSKFCAASGDGFNVLPEGIVTSCYEVTESNDPRASLFHYGHYDFERKEFNFNEEKIGSLMKFSVENILYCKNCFCKWHCGGDCLSKVFEASNSFEHEGSPRCELNRSLSLYQLEKIVSKSNN